MIRKFIRHILILGFLLAGCAWQDDVRFARSLMDQLIDGKYTARTMIDWTKLKFLGNDISESYAKCQGEACKLTYERAFIENFSKGYKKAGAKKTAFFNWRIFKKEGPSLTLVAANVYDETTTFLFSVAHTGGDKKIVEIRIIRPVGAPDMGSAGEKNAVPVQ